MEFAGIASLNRNCDMRKTVISSIILVNIVQSGEKLWVEDPLSELKWPP